ncbi:MAG: tripartite tricarboxylate transporter TctB family protein [Clostridia bacterium]|jgi:putative tricarboxylic transport membrane protein|nr:tripartite tricarboxylate transporter TctB family protein [Spirochaetia bacterium]
MDIRNFSPLRNKATLAGTLLLGVTLPYLFAVSRFPDTSQRFRSLGPEVFPNILGWISVLLAVLLIMEGGKSKPAPIFPGTAKQHNVLRAIALVGILVLVTLSLDFLGFVIVSFLFTAVVQFLLGEKRAIRLLVISVLTTAVLYALFILLLRIPLPRGLIG